MMSSSRFWSISRLVILLLIVVPTSQIKHIGHTVKQICRHLENFQVKQELLKSDATLGWLDECFSESRNGWIYFSFKRIDSDRTKELTTVNSQDI